MLPTAVWCIFFIVGFDPISLVPLTNHLLVQVYVWNGLVELISGYAIPDSGRLLYLK